MRSFSVLIAREEEFSNRLSNKANFRDCTPLHYAVLADDFDITKLILEHGEMMFVVFTLFSKFLYSIHVYIYIYIYIYI